MRYFGLLWGMMWGWMPSGFAQIPQRVWIDTDIVFDRFGRDVDDGIALMMACQAEEWEIIGVSLVIDVAHGEKVARRILTAYHPQREIPLYRGADQPEELGRPSAAVEAMAEALREGPMTIIALGPATNLATFLQLYPQLSDSIERVVYCAGRSAINAHFRVGKSKRNLPDYNVEVDPLATKWLIDSEVPLTLAGFEPSSSMYLSRKMLKPLKAGNHPDDRWVWRQVRDWLFAWRVYLRSKKGFVPFDAVTVGCVLRPEWFKRDKQVHVYLTNGVNDSRMVIKDRRKPYLLVNRQEGNDRVCEYVFETLPDFPPFLLSTILRQSDSTLNGS